MKTIILLFGLSLSFSVFGQTTIPTDTYFNFPLDGNATDIGGDNHSGTIVGGVTATTDRLGKTSGAMQFNGTNGYIDIPYSTSVGTADFSVSYWANPSASNSGFVFSKEQSGVPANGFRMGSSGDYFGSFVDNTNTYGGGLPYNPDINLWSFYTIIRQGNSIKLYVNGVYKSSLTTAGIINHSNTLNYRIGWRYSGTTYFNGKIDDLRMFKHALSTDEITALYTYVEPTNSVDPPVITSFSPLNGSIGSTVTLTGTGFNSTMADNVVRFGSVKATVTSATPTQLTVIVPMGTTYQNITITDLSTSLTGYSSTPFVVTSFSCGAISRGSFSNKMNISADAVYQNVNACDLDGDGKTDLVCTGDYKITTFRNTSTVGAISFTANSDYVTGLSVQLSTGDLNGDGKTDLVVTNSNGTVSIYINTSVPSTISFAPKVDFTFTTGSQKTAINDLDGDGKLDLTIISGGNLVSVLKNTSTTSTLSFAPKVDLVSGIQVPNVEIGDLDGDKKPDIAITYWGNTISVLRNTSVKGTISFASKVDFTVGDYPQGISIGDLDGDGKPDLAVPNTNSGSVSLLRNTSTIGAISFAAKMDYTSFVQGGTNGVSIGDFDGDGKLDLVVLENNRVIVLHNTSVSGTFSFVAKYAYSDSWYNWCASICDFDGDEKPDIAVANDFISVFRNEGYVPAIAAINTSVVTESSFNITPIEVETYAVPVGTTYTWTTPSVTGGMTGGASGSGTSISGTLINHTRTDQTATYTVIPTSSCGTGVPFNIVVTVNPLPFVITSFTPVNSNIGSTVTITGTGFDSIPANYEVRFGDVKAEITAATYTSFTVVVPIGATYDKISITDKITGSLIYSPLFFRPTFMCGGAINSSTFDVRKDFNVGSGSKRIEVGDLDGDKKTDVVIIYPTGITSSILSIFRNTSTSEEISFAPEVNYLTGATPISIAIGDLDGDGKPDIAIANYHGNTVSVFHNTSVIGTISFATKVDYTVGFWANCVRIADWDNDGKLDLLVSSSFNGNPSTYSQISAFYNTSTPGTISFTNRDDITRDGITSFSVGHIDGNRMNDYVATNLQAVSVYYNHRDNHRFYNSWWISSGWLTSSFTQGQIIGDWDGDNKPDFAVIMSDKLLLFQNTGNSDDNMTYVIRPSFAIIDRAYTLNSGKDIKTSDLDGDGKLDIALVSSDKSISVFRNTTTNDSISFARQDYPLTSYSMSLAIGDLNSDGKPDMIVSSETGFSVFKNLGAVPIINKMAVTVNSDSVFSITPQDVIDGLVPSGTTYMWTAPTVTANVTGGVDGSGTSIIGKLTNLTSTNQNVTYLVTPGCSGNSFSLNVIVKPKINTGLVINNDNLTTLSLTPNPATNGFTINIGNQKSIISIYELSGSLVFSKQIEGKSYVDITSLPSGVYVVKANGLVGKLVKK